MGSKIWVGRTVWTGLLVAIVVAAGLVVRSGPGSAQADGTPPAGTAGTSAPLLINLAFDEGSGQQALNSGSLSTLEGTFQFIGSSKPVYIEPGVTPPALSDGIVCQSAVHFDRGPIDNSDRSDNAGYIEVPARDSYDNLSNGSVAAWFYAEDDQGAIVTKNSTGFNVGDMSVQIGNNPPFDRLDFRLEDGVVGQAVFSLDPIALNTWYHFVGTWDAEDGMKLYVDGVFQGANPFAGGMSRAPEDLNKSLLVGTSHLDFLPDELSFPFKGAIDEVKLYDRALDSIEVRSLFEQGCKSPTATPTVTPTETPTPTPSGAPLSVGGIGMDPQLDGVPLDAAETSGGNGRVLVSIAAAITTGAVVLGGVAWYVWRRRLA